MGPLRCDVCTSKEVHRSRERFPSRQMPPRKAHSLKDGGFPRRFTVTKMTFRTVSLALNDGNCPLAVLEHCLNGFCGNNRYDLEVRAYFSHEIRVVRN